MEDNFIAYITRRPFNETQVLEGVLNKDAVVSVCATDPQDKCYNLIVKGNIAAGSDTLYGFVSYAHTCGQAAHQQAFRNNIAHSTNVGIRLFPNPTIASHKNCTEASHNYMYKNEQNYLFSSNGEETRMTKCMMADAFEGVSISLGDSSYKDKIVKI